MDITQPSTSTIILSQILLFLLAFAVGGMVSSYLTINSLAADRVNSDLLANIPYFLIGALTVLLLHYFLEGRPPFAKLSSLSWWMFLTGIAGGLAVFLTTQLIGQIGPDKYFVASVAGQIIISVIIAHFGWFEVEQNSIDWRKIAGVALAIAGAVLVSYRA